MKAFVGLALGAVLLLSITAPLVSPDPSEAGARSCYGFWAEADKMGSHYRHTVYVENDCEYWLQCSVWTDVDPPRPTEAPNTTIQKPSEPATGSDRGTGEHDTATAPPENG
jgi:hypothetical protein